jgi:hypothetical protein
VPLSFYSCPFDFHGAASDGNIHDPLAQTAACDMIPAHQLAVVSDPIAPAPATRGPKTAPKVGLGGFVGRGLGV